MSFTDNDLKQWKEYIEPRDKRYTEDSKENVCLDPPFPLNQFKSLISRLEAAEAIVEKVLPPTEVWHPKLIEAWRKAAGK
jgi:hypothetical protein